MKRLGLLLVVLLVAVTFMAGAQAKPALKLLAISRWNPDPTWAPTDTSLQKAVAAAANAYVGRTVNVEWGSFPVGTNYDQFLQMREAAGNMPDILLLDNLMYDAPGYEYAIKRGLIKEITLADLNKYMPGYVARFKQYGVDVSYAISDNLKSNDPGKGKMWFVPFQFGPYAFTNVPNNFSKPYVNGMLLGGNFQDNIMKKIFPTARTEAEFRKMLVEKKGKATIEDMTDIPIKSWSDLYAYFKKVKAMNLKVGEKPVIPGALIGDMENADQLTGHLNSAAGGYLYRGAFWWQDAPTWAKAVLLSPEIREMARWVNRMYNEGLLDPELFVMKNAQFYAKVGNGEYAVFPSFYVPVDNALKTAKERGYGYRMIPYFYPIDMSRINNKYTRVFFGSVGIFVTSKVKAADYGDVLKYIDYFMTEKSDDLAYWGLPAWSTGTGVNRKFKPEYKDLENWAVYGIPGGKDGTYYGVGGAQAINMTNGKNYQYGTKPFAFWQMNQFTYPWAPHYTYRANPSWDSAKELENVAMSSYYYDWWSVGFLSPLSTYYRINKGFDWFTNQYTTTEWVDYSKNVDASTRRGLIARAVVGSESDFDDNWDLLTQYLVDAGLEKAEQAAAKALEANFTSNILQSVIKK
jgi:hypothetical protein